MSSHGRYLQFRHAFPEFFGPGIQTQRGMLRLKWLLFGNVDYRPVWAIGVSAGLVGILLTIVLFALPTDPTLQAAVALKPEAPPPASIPSQTELPLPTISQPALPLPPQVHLVTYMERLFMPRGWHDRRMAVVTSSEPTFKPDPYAAYTVRDGWQLAANRPVQFPEAFVPYREPAGLRHWEATTSPVVVGASANPSIAKTAQPTVRVEKRIAPHPGRPGLLKYELVVSNSGSQRVPEVNVVEALDVRRVTLVEPPALIEQNGLTWRLGAMAPYEERRLTFSLLVEGQLAASTQTEIQLADQFSAVTQVEQEAPYYPQPPAVTPPAQPQPQPQPQPQTPPRSSIPQTPPRSSIPAQPPQLPVPRPQQPAPQPQQPATQPVYRPILHLKTHAPEGGAVGDDVATWFEVTNSGNAAAVDVLLCINLPVGLKHYDGATLVQHRMARIEPGETRRARLVTRIEAPGDYRLASQLISGDIESRHIVEVSIPNSRATTPSPGSSLWNPVPRRLDEQIVQAGMTVPGNSPTAQWLPSSNSIRTPEREGPTRDIEVPLDLPPFPEL